MRAHERDLTHETWTDAGTGVHGFWRCPALESMQFGVRYELGELNETTVRLDISAELLGASEVEKDDVEDVNQVISQIQEIFNANAENLKAMAEAQFRGSAYERERAYKIAGYLCE